MDTSKIKKDDPKNNEYYSILYHERGHCIWLKGSKNSCWIFLIYNLIRKHWFITINNNWWCKLKIIPDRHESGDDTCLATDWSPKIQAYI